MLTVYISLTDALGFDKKSLELKGDRNLGVAVVGALEAILS